MNASPHFDPTKFKEQLSLWVTENPAIIMAQVDPDALGAAFALQHITQKLLDVTVPIYYSGSISHPQNKCIVNRYDLLSSMDRIEDFEEEVSNAQIALVDSSKRNDARVPQIKQSKISIVIDHHRATDLDHEECFLWIDEVGACCTMMCEIAFACEVSFTNKLKTIQALGIYTDTKALIAATQRDRDAYAWLVDTLNPTDFNQFIEYPLPDSHFRNLKQALSGMRRERDRIVAGCGVTEDIHGDDLSTIADYLIRMSGITLVIVWGLIGNKVRISARNRDLTTPLDQFLKSKFGEMSGAKLAPDGRGEGGAMLDLDLGYWLSEATKGPVLEMVKAKIDEEIFGAVEKKEVQG